MDAIRIDKLAKSFGEVRALAGISFSVPAGQIFGLVGPDGAGKTTTMRLLTGIMEPTSGEAWVLGKNSASEPEAIKNEIGYMSQRFGLYSDLSVMENLRFFADIYDVPAREREKSTERLLEFSKLAPFRKRAAGKLSGGMKQKLGLMCALIHTPKILFLDEPTNGVDPVSRRDFWRILYQLLKEGVTIFISTAYLDEAERCHRVGLIQQGKLLACDTPANVRKMMRESVLRVSTRQNRRAAAILGGIFHPESVNLFGSGIHVTTGSPDESAEKIRLALDAEGIAVEEIRVINPTLEDTFISMLTTTEA